MKEMRSTGSNSQKMKNILKKQISELRLSKIVNLCSWVRDPNITRKKLLMRKQKMPTAGASAERIRLPSIRQQMQKTSPRAATSAVRMRLCGAPQQQSRNQAKYS